MSACAGCGTPITQPPSRGRRRKWCSDRCRKRTLYSGTCEICGGPTNGSNGRDAASDVCRECHEQRNAERNAEIIRRWNEDEPQWYIAEQMGLRSEEQVKGAIDRARKRGEGVSLHRRRNRSDWPEIERLYREGLTYREIGERLGISPANAANRVSRMRTAGIDLPRRRA